MEIAPGVSVDNAVCHGTPVLTGTRMPVSLVVAQLAGGVSVEEVMDEYRLTKDQVHTALAYAARLVEEIEVVAVAGAQA